LITFSRPLRLYSWKAVLRPVETGGLGTKEKERKTMAHITYGTKRMTVLLALMLVLGSMLAPAGKAQAARYSLQIENASSWHIYKLFLSPSYSDIWGRDLLGRRVLTSGYVFSTDVRSGLYDLKLVDEDGDTCIVHRIAVNGETSWRITNAWLLSCEFR
jgi:hypothetical protein